MFKGSLLYLRYINEKNTTYVNHFLFYFHSVFGEIIGYAISPGPQCTMLKHPVHSLAPLPYMDIHPVNLHDFKENAEVP